MDLDSFFLETLEDIRKRSEGQVSPYEALMAAGLLRKLLLDSAPLVHQVNRSRRIQLRFRFTEPRIPNDPKPFVWSMQDGFDPDTALPAGRLVVDGSLGVVLRQEILYADGRGFTVQALILGSVHAGTASTPEDMALAELSSQFEIGGLDPAVRSLRAVSRVILQGLEPLEAAVRRELPSTEPIGC